MEIEFQGTASHKVDFSKMRDTLLLEKSRFDAQSIRVIPYHQIPLCCIGNAGEAACDPDLVKKEMSSRRDQFLSLETEDFKEAENYLRIEQMYSAVVHAINSNGALQWSSLTRGQQLWTRLTCLYNHVDNPEPRVQLALEAFSRCIRDSTCSIPPDVCKTYASKLKNLTLFYPNKLSDEAFRSKLLDILHSILDFIPDQERKDLEKEQFNGFSCTSDCFKIVV